MLYICSSLLGYGKEAVAAAVAAAAAADSRQRGAQGPSNSSARASSSTGGASLRDEDAWQGWYAGHLKVFSNDFRFAETTAVVLREGEARMLVALEGDAARQPYYREVCMYTCMYIYLYIQSTYIYIYNIYIFLYI